jgi:hypothetical protein
MRDYTVMVRVVLGRKTEESFEMTDVKLASSRFSRDACCYSTGTVCTYVHYYHRGQQIRIADSIWECSTYAGGKVRTILVRVFQVRYRTRYVHAEPTVRGTVPGTVPGMLPAVYSCRTCTRYHTVVLGPATQHHNQATCWYRYVPVLPGTL